MSCLVHSHSKQQQQQQQQYKQQKTYKTNGNALNDVKITSHNY